MVQQDFIRWQRSMYWFYKIKLSKKGFVMALFAIGDFHLSFQTPEKSMDVFGAMWRHHEEKIKRNCEALVGPHDTLVITGDHSWGRKLAECEQDLAFIEALPGRKILLRGNHDFWWGAITRVRESLPAGMYALQNDAMVLSGITFCGTRGWTHPQGSEEGEDARLYARELIRLRLSLEQARRLSPNGPLVALTHYPPLGEGGVRTPVSDLMEEFGVGDVVYGHLHGASIKTAFIGRVEGVRYHFVSCDGLDFKLYQMPAIVGSEA